MRFYLLSCVIRDVYLHIRLYSFFVKPPALAGFFVLCHLLNTCTSCVCVCCSVESSVFTVAVKDTFLTTLADLTLAGTTLCDSIP